MKTLVVSVLVTLTLATGCSKKDSSSCEQVFEHTLSLMPAEMKSKLEGGKDAAIAKCEKMPAEARQCALDAKSIEDLTKCSH